ncbi:glycoside hydrolase family 32 protein [Acidicapsa dinghuensis]|uniref:Glycoside hydrolase family 32 protein n=1 Tax=Acidicapsa dinghuensis TaxID=2218256 RepID=A0ABW1EC90_9BACT|nr:glycoside hydrolase family 32 protein [Acidicapsa dinghuensis]
MQFRLPFAPLVLTGNSNDPRCSHGVKQQLRFRSLRTALAIVLLTAPICLLAQSRTLHISKHYLNIPIANSSEMHVFQIQVDGVQKREFPAQLAEQSPDYWIFIDVSQFKGQTITLSGPSSQAALNRIYQSDKIEGANTLYKERDRPQFHFTVKRGWNNDVNGPIFYRGQYHLFWQAFPFGNNWDTGFMYWGHAVSKDLVHWRELAPALMLDHLGSPWSGSSFVDHNNVGGWGKDALVLFYTAFDRHTKKQVQCIAYSTDNGVTFTRYTGNPVLDTNREVGSNDTRDPHVFWYEPTHHWVMVLFEKDGLSIFTSNDLKQWTRKSHFKGLYECPDLFELPVDGDPHRTKWILHGGSVNYYIGSFDGESFTPESPELHYAEGKNLHGDDALYAAQSFAEMPDGRRIQMAWGRIKFEGMPFTQMMLFPTEFKLVTTQDGLRMRATPIAEIEKLHRTTKTLSSLTLTDANRALNEAGSNPLDVSLNVALATNDALSIRYNGNPIATIQSEELQSGSGSIEILIDKGVAEIFVDQGARYLVRELSTGTCAHGLELAAGSDTTQINRLQISEMKSMWAGQEKGR